MSAFAGKQTFNTIKSNDRFILKADVDECLLNNVYLSLFKLSIAVSLP
jgi:hypothetical protein